MSVEPSVITLPGSKSISARLLAAAWLGGGGCVVEGLSESADTHDMARVLSCLSDGPAPMVHAGEGGTTLRFAMAAAAAVPGCRVMLTGTPGLTSRPMEPLVRLLVEAGGSVECQEMSDGSRVWIVEGCRLKGGRYTVPADVSSQFLSALLLSAPLRGSDTEFVVEGPMVSAPYVDMTVSVMRMMGAGVECRDSRRIVVRADGYSLPRVAHVAPDWSAASYFYEISLLWHSVGREWVPEFSPVPERDGMQGDECVADMFGLLGRASGGAPDAVRLECRHTPDLVPALLAGACGAGIPVEIRGVASLRHKECDRVAVLVRELGRLGYVVIPDDDTLRYDGTRRVGEVDPVIDPEGDHRMAMAIAPLAAVCGPLSILSPGVVGKSFPGFWTQMGRAGYLVEPHGDSVRVIPEE